MATVFARLKVPAADGSGAIDDQGVHAFIVPLRDSETKQLLPGVEIHDNEYKVCPRKPPSRNLCKHSMILSTRLNSLCLGKEISSHLL